MSTTIRARGISEHELKGILPGGSILTLNDHQFVVSLSQDGHIVKQANLCGGELLLLARLLQRHPDYVSYAEMLSTYEGLEQALCSVRIETNSQDVLRKMRRVLSDLRRKIEPLGITVNSLNQTGYKLFPCHEVAQ